MSVSPILPYWIRRREREQATFHARNPIVDFMNTWLERGARYVYWSTHFYGGSEVFHITDMTGMSLSEHYWNYQRDGDAAYPVDMMIVSARRNESWNMSYGPQTVNSHWRWDMETDEFCMLEGINESTTYPPIRPMGHDVFGTRMTMVSPIGFIVQDICST